MPKIQLSRVYFKFGALKDASVSLNRVVQGTDVMRSSSYSNTFCVSRVERQWTRQSRGGLMTKADGVPIHCTSTHPRLSVRLVTRQLPWDSTPPAMTEEIRCTDADLLAYRLAESMFPIVAPIRMIHLSDRLGKLNSIKANSLRRSSSSRLIS